MCDDAAGVYLHYVKIIKKYNNYDKDFEIVHEKIMKGPNNHAVKLALIFDVA